jgi:Fe-S-cluster-containing dehydrogenase component
MPEGAQSFHDAQMYFLPYQCQHCENPECVSVCPTNASHKLDDGTVLVDKSKCIGCQFCVMACPYGVRYLNEEERVVEKCTLCEQKTAQGELPQCVAQCCARARFYGDLDEGYESFEGASDTKLTDYVETFTEDDVHHLKDVGNKPSFAYILRTYEGRRNKVWQGGE